MHNNLQIQQSTRSYQEVQDDLMKCASRLSEATNRLAGSVGAPQHVLSEAVNTYVYCFKSFFNCGLEMTSHQQDRMVQMQMVDGLRSVAYESSRLLETIKISSADPNSPNVKQQLTAAARYGKFWKIDPGLSNICCPSKGAVFMGPA